LDPPPPATVGLLLPPPFKQRRQWHTRSHPLANPLSRAPEHLRPRRTLQIPAKSRRGISSAGSDSSPPSPSSPGSRSGAGGSLFPTDRGRWRDSSFLDAAEAAPCLASHGLDHSSGGPAPSRCGPFFLDGRMAAAKETCVAAVPRRRRSTSRADQHRRRAAGASLTKKQNHGCG
jgi:hypothetical protein